MGMKLPPDLQRKVLDMAGEGSKPAVKQRDKRVLPKLRGKHKNVITLRLPWPPSVNNCYVNVGKRRVLSKRGRQYPKDVEAVCVQQEVGHVTGDLRVTIWTYPKDKRRHDSDNLLKMIFDSLQKCGLYADDSQIKEFTVKKEDPETPACVLVYIEGEP